MPTKKVAKGITRFENEPHNSNGFLVRICRNGHRVNQFFSDNTYGGKRKARQAADQRYQELLDEYGPALPSVKGRLTTRNSTGIVGVHVAQGIDSRWPGSECWAYCASWVDDEGNRGKISFSWRKYGEKAALRLATIARTHESTDRGFILSIYEKERANEQKRKALKAKATRKTPAGKSKSVKSKPAREVKKQKPAPEKRLASAKKSSVKKLVLKKAAVKKAGATKKSVARKSSAVRKKAR